MSLTDTAIIGAGPYGLSLSAHLKAAGIPHQILGQPMEAWRKFMPPGMIMRSEAFASNLFAPQRGYTVEDYCKLKGIPYEHVGMALPLETFVDYALWFQANVVPDVRPAEVVRLKRADGTFHLALTDGGSLTARRVVIALGLKGFERMPVALRGFPRRYISHSAEYGSLDWARDKDIAIVGGGQSALGLAALLNEVGARVHVLVRGASVRWLTKLNPSRGLVSTLRSPDAGLGRGWSALVLSECPWLFHMLTRSKRRRVIQNAFGPAGAWWLHDRIVDKVKISLRTEVREATIENDRVVLHVASENERSRIDFDHVIAATGFKTDIRRHEFISSEIIDSLALDDGLPELTHNYETSIRGLYVIGPASAHSFGPVMRFVYGAKHAAPRVARHIGHAARARARKEIWTPGESTVAEAASERTGSV